jgi:hypothetical protein
MDPCLQAMLEATAAVGAAHQRLEDAQADVEEAEALASQLTMHYLEVHTVQPTSH